MDFSAGPGDFANPLAIDPQTGENFGHPSLRTAGAAAARRGDARTSASWTSWSTVRRARLARRQQLTLGPRLDPVSEPQLADPDHQERGADPAPRRGQHRAERPAAGADRTSTWCARPRAGWRRTPGRSDQASLITELLYNKRYSLHVRGRAQLDRLPALRPAGRPQDQRARGPTAGRDLHRRCRSRRRRYCRGSSLARRRRMDVDEPPLAKRRLVPHNWRSAGRPRSGSRHLHGGAHMSRRFLPIGSVPLALAAAVLHSRGLRRRSLEVLRQLVAGPVRRGRGEDEPGVERQRGADAAVAPLARFGGHEGQGGVQGRHAALQGRHRRQRLPDGRRALRGEPDRGRAAHRGRRAWTTAAAGARRWWGPGRSRDSGRPLLGDAVEGAEPPDQVGAVDADHVAAGKQLLQRGRGPPRRAAGS